MSTLTQQIQAHANELGFELVGGHTRSTQRDNCAIPRVDRKRVRWEDALPRKASLPQDGCPATFGRSEVCY